MKSNYIITGRRTSGEIIFYCASPIHGNRLIPNAYSLATRMTLKQARITLEILGPDFKGITAWCISQANLE